MPVLIYFVLVTPILLGMIAMSQAVLGPPKGLSVSTAWHGLPKHEAPPVTVAVAHHYDEYQPIPLPAEAMAAMASENAQFSVIEKAVVSGPKVAAKVAKAELAKPELAKSKSVAQAKKSAAKKARKRAQRRARYREYARYDAFARYW